MNRKELDISDVHLELEMQGLFDTTTPELTNTCLQSLGRAAAQIPRHRIPWFSLWSRHASGLMCVTLFFLIISDSNFFTPGSTLTQDLAGEFEQVDFIAAVLENDNVEEWDPELKGIGFELFHVSDPMGAKLLEGSMEALLREKNE